MDARILVADSNPGVTLLIERHFEALGHEVVTTHDGLDAYELGATGGFDLAFIEHFLPTILGAEILQRWSEDGVRLPTIVVSSLDDEAMVVRCLELGAADFIRKPFNTSELSLRATIHLARQ